MGLLVAPGPLSPVSSSSLVLSPGPTGGSSLICQLLCASGCQASAASMPPTVPGPFGDQFGALTFDFPVGIDEDDDAEAELAAGVALLTPLYSLSLPTCQVQQHTVGGPSFRGWTHAWGICSASVWQAPESLHRKVRWRTLCPCATCPSLLCVALLLGCVLSCLWL